MDEVDAADRPSRPLRPHRPSTPHRTADSRDAGGFTGRTDPYGSSGRRNAPAPLGPPGATIKVSVHLPESMPPVADEFLRAVVGNLRISLSDAYVACLSELDDQLRSLQNWHNGAVENLQGGDDPAAVRIREQLDTIVDLSVLTPEMPFGEAVEILRKSVDPPLNIVVLWNDLLDSADVEPSTPIGIDGMPSVELKTTLDLLVKNLQHVGANLVWRIKGDAIVIATPAALGEPAGPAGQPIIETDIRTLAAQRDELSRKLQDLELNLAGQEARRKAIVEQIVQTQHQTQKKLADNQVTQELTNLVRLNEESLSNLRKQVDAGRASTAELTQATENLARARIELAKRREELSRQVGGGQLEQLNGEMSRIMIDRAEKQARRDILRRQLTQVQQQLARASAFDPEAARARTAREGIDILARRITELQMRIANLQRPMVTVIGAN
jgi:hypothetical protein